MPSPFLCKQILLLIRIFILFAGFLLLEDTLIILLVIYSLTCYSCCDYKKYPPEILNLVLTFCKWSLIITNSNKFISSCKWCSLIWNSNCWCCLSSCRRCCWSCRCNCCAIYYRSCCHSLISEGYRCRSHTVCCCKCCINNRGYCRSCFARCCCS